MSREDLFNKHKQNIDEALNFMLVDYVKHGVPPEKIISDLASVSVLSLAFVATQRMSMCLQMGDKESNLPDKVHQELVSIMNTDGFAYVRKLLHERAESVKAAIIAAHESVQAGGAGVAFIKNGQVEVDTIRNGSKSTKQNLH